MLQIIQSKQYGSVPVVGSIYDLLLDQSIEIDFYEINKKDSEGLTISEFEISVRALVTKPGLSNYGFIVRSEEFPTGGHFIHIAESLIQANEIVAELKANIEAYINDLPSSSPEDLIMPQGRYMPGVEYNRLIEKYTFIHAQFAVWPGQGEHDDVPQTEIFSKILRKATSRDCAGEITKPIVVAYNPLERKERLFCVYEVATMHEAIALSNQLQTTLVREGIENLQKQLNDTLKP